MGFEPAVPAVERLQIYVSDRVATRDRPCIICISVMVSIHLTLSNMTSRTIIFNKYLLLLLLLL